MRGDWNRKVRPGKHRRWNWFRKFKNIAKTVVNLVTRPKSPTGSALLLILTTYAMLVIYVHLNLIFWIIVAIATMMAFTFLAGKILGYRRKIRKEKGAWMGVKGR